MTSDDPAPGPAGDPGHGPEVLGAEDGPEDGDDTDAEPRNRPAAAVLPQTGMVDDLELVRSTGIALILAGALVLLAQYRPRRQR
ncbi:MAG TPA: hypothetical protein VLA97_05275 [Nocardioidaceae bacterium]|nr:hypothetical protein [Nocardioidaceae bacterium]